MFLTDEEAVMLDGGKGPAVQKAMQILVALGESFGAERLVPVNNVHMAGSSVLVAEEAGTRFVEDIRNQGGKFITRVTTNPTAVDPTQWADIGIPESDIKKLGRPFEQVENQFSKSHQGSGLGLAISRALIELHGGSLQIKSREGQGTTVTCTLPIKAVTEEEEDAGLDISEHGMYGYPEQFIPPEEYPGGGTAVGMPVPSPTAAAPRG